LAKLGRIALIGLLDVVIEIGWGCFQKNLPGAKVCRFQGGVLQELVSFWHAA